MNDPLVLLTAFAMGLIVGAAVSHLCRGRVDLFLAVQMRDGKLVEEPTACSECQEANCKAGCRCWCHGPGGDA